MKDDSAAATPATASETLQECLDQGKGGPPIKPEDWSVLDHFVDKPDSASVGKGDTVQSVSRELFRMGYEHCDITPTRGMEISSAIWTSGILKSKDPELFLELAHIIDKHLAATPSGGGEKWTHNKSVVFEGERQGTESWLFMALNEGEAEKAERFHNATLPRDCGEDEWKYDYGEMEAACGGETAQAVRRAIIKRRKAIDATLSQTRRGEKSQT